MVGAGGNNVGQGSLTGLGLLRGLFVNLGEVAAVLGLLVAVALAVIAFGAVDEVTSAAGAALQGLVVHENTAAGAGFAGL